MRASRSAGASLFILGRPKLAVLLELALAIIFNWRPFIESFSARATRPLVSFGVALAFGVYFNFDAVTGLDFSAILCRFECLSLKVGFRWYGRL